MTSPIGSIVSYSGLPATGLGADMSVGTTTNSVTRPRHRLHTSAPTASGRILTTHAAPRPPTSAPPAALNGAANTPVMR